MIVINMQDAAQNDYTTLAVMRSRLKLELLGLKSQSSTIKLCNKRFGTTHRTKQAAFDWIESRMSDMRAAWEEQA